MKITVEVEITQSQLDIIYELVEDGWELESACSYVLQGTFEDSAYAQVIDKVFSYIDATS